MDKEVEPEVVRDDGFRHEEAAGHAPAEDGNALLADYLSALLASPVVRTLDFSEGPVPGNLAGDYSSRSRATVKVVNNTLQFEPQPDAGELRAENDALKLKVARLVAKLDETECRLEAVLAQNDDLKSSLEGLRIQLELSRIVARNATRPPRPEPPPLVEKSEKPLPPEASAIVLPELAEFAAPPAAEPAAPADLEYTEVETAWEEVAEVEESVKFERPEDIFEAAESELVLDLEIGREPAEGDVSPPAIDPEWYEPEESSGYSPEFAAPRESLLFQIEPAFLEGVDAGEEKPAPAPAMPAPAMPAPAMPAPAMPAPAMPAAARTAVAAESREPEGQAPPKARILPASALQKAKFSSKVIKKDHEPQKAQPVQAAEKPPTPKPRLGPLPANLLQEIPPPEEASQQVAEQQGGQVAEEQLPEFACVDSPDVEPAPVPKGVIRRHLNNYQKLQAEADSAEEGTADNTHLHTLR